MPRPVQGLIRRGGKACEGRLSGGGQSCAETCAPAPRLAGKPGRPKAGVAQRTVFLPLSPDGRTGRLSVCPVLRRAMIRVLADGTARPGGRLIDTGTEDGA